MKFRRTNYLPPYAFTEHGVVMLSSVLRSKKAIELNIAIVRTFIALRQYAMNFKELAQNITELEAKYDGQFDEVYKALHLHSSERKNKIEQVKRKRIGYKRKYEFTNCDFKSDASILNMVSLFYFLPHWSRHYLQIINRN